jgi:DNA-binding transcriptional LysR family regulator
MAVAEYGHLTRAAHSLHLTQPALSSQIHYMESFIGVALFVRHARGVSLTPAGEAFALHARRALIAIEAGIDAAHAAEAGRNEVLRIGLITGAQVDMISRVLRDLRATQPDLRVELFEYSFAEPDAGLRAGEVDAAFLVLPINLDGLEHEELSRPGLVAVFPETHRLADRSEIAIDEILDEPWVATQTTDEECRNYWLAMSHRVTPPLVHHRVKTMDKFMQLVAANEAVGMAPAWVKDGYSGYPLRCIPLTGIASPAIALAWLSTTKNSHVDALRAAATAARSAST